MTLQPPFSLATFVAENRHRLQPPVGAVRIFENAQMIVMAVGGPNTRRDFHIDPGEEFFYQLEGDMVLRIHEHGAIRDITIAEGEIFMLPAWVPHSPQRRAGTVGLVIERPRVGDEADGVRWYCESCGGALHEQWFRVREGGFLPQLNAAIEHFHATPELRKCKNCGTVQNVPTAG
jgi:3-hydroxyanthranilate 3,4-dioxygenase